MDEKKEKEYGPYGLPEVEVIGTMPPWMRKQLGALFDQNPGLFRYAMQHAPNEQVRQLYFTVCFNTARQRAAEEFAMTALATAGCISFIAAAPSILSTTVPFLRQGAMMSSYAIRRGNMIAARMFDTLEQAGAVGYQAVSNALLRNASYLRNVTNMTAQMLYPRGVTWQMMMKGATMDFGMQLATKTLFNRYFRDKSWNDAGTEAIEDLNFVEIAANALYLPLLLRTSTPAAFNLSWRKQESVLSGNKGVDKFLYDWGTNYAFGKVESGISFNFRAREISLAAGINTAIQIPQYTETTMQMIYRSLRFGENVSRQSVILNIEVYKEWQDAWLNNKYKR